MTPKLELNPATESGLFAQAEARGLSLEAYAQRLLEEHAAAPRAAGLPVHERLRAFDEFVQALQSQAVISDEAFHRANWYPENG